MKLTQQLEMQIPPSNLNMRGGQNIQQRCIALEKSLLQCRRSPILLIPNAQHVLQVSRTNWPAHQVPCARNECVSIRVPPVVEPDGVRPRQLIVGIAGKRVVS